MGIAVRAPVFQAVRGDCRATPRDAQSTTAQKQSGHVLSSAVPNLSRSLARQEASSGSNIATARSTHLSTWGSRCCPPWRRPLSRRTGATTRNSSGDPGDSTAAVETFS
eukprot:364168-Chlamydomonas_euryale.AAC.8